MTDIRDEVLDRMRARGAERMHAPRDVALQVPFLDVSAVWRCLLDLADEGAVVEMSGDRFRLAPGWRDGEQLSLGGRR